MFLSVPSHYTRRAKEQWYWDKQSLPNTVFLPLAAKYLGQRVRLKYYKL